MVIRREQYPYRIIVVFKICSVSGSHEEHRVQNEHPNSTLFIRGGGVPSSTSDIVFQAAAVMIVVKFQVTNFNFQDTGIHATRPIGYYNTSRCLQLIFFHLVKVLLGCILVLQ